MYHAQTSVRPDALMLARGGSTAAALRLTGQVLDRLADQGAVPARGFEARASWVAIVATEQRGRPAGVDTIDWDPATPIPPGTIELRCTGYSVALDNEDAQA